jgi:ABC-type dipeptide/oligopeptide/nickel transport system permease component
VFAVVVVVGNLVADLLYAVLDPRIRYERAGS